MPDKIVHRVEDDMDPREILCTTYQMRNFYAQLKDGFYSSLDIMNYIQHEVAARLPRKGERVLDVCCGRGLLLPLLRWHNKEIESYWGVDIEPKNSAEIWRRSGVKDIKGLRHSPLQEGDEDPYYPFPVNIVESNVATMTATLTLKDMLGTFDVAIYTASIEHMQREAGVSSLKEVFQLLAPGGVLFLSSPNTTEKTDPYDTQYKAHLYEWPREELLEVCKDVGFELQQEFGLVAKVRGYRDKLEKWYPELVPAFDALDAYLPSAWLYGMFPVATPLIADEVAFLLSKPA